MNPKTIRERLKYDGWLKFVVVSVLLTKENRYKFRFSSNGVLDPRKLLVITPN